VAAAGAAGETTMTQRGTAQVIGLRHVGLSARDPGALAEFYRDVLFLHVVPTDTSDLGANVFLSSHPAEVSVDVALFDNPAYEHIAFEVHSLADLRAFHQHVIRRGVPVKMALNHGVSLSFYFDDPEGHLIEVYWSMGFACRPRHGDPIDLALPEEVLRRDVAESAARAAATIREQGSIATNSNEEVTSKDK
jgi:catechol-2,3-dioxygenase